MSNAVSYFIAGLVISYEWNVMCTYYTDLSMILCLVYVWSDALLVWLHSLYYVRDNWPKIKEYFTGSFMLQLVSSVCSEFASEEWALEMELCMRSDHVLIVVFTIFGTLLEFFNTNPVINAERTDLWRHMTEYTMVGQG